MTLNLKALILLIHICLVSTMAQAQGTVSRKSATALPTVTEIDGFMKRTFGYDPSITWQIVDIRESSIAGITELVASMNKGLPTHLYFSSSAQSAIVGEMIPFGKDPFAPARAKLQAANGPSRGSETPSSRIVVFTDLQCADCKAAQPIVERLAADFPRVLFTFQQFPLSAKHPWAMKGAEYADWRRVSAWTRSASELARYCQEPMNE